MNQLGLLVIMELLVESDNSNTKLWFLSDNMQITTSTFNSNKIV